MVFALQGFTKEFIALQMDGIGVEYTGRTYLLFVFALLYFDFHKSYENDLLF